MMKNKTDYSKSRSRSIFLWIFAAVFFFGCCTPKVPSEKQPLKIDVHTHIFNGEDVPLKGFLRKVVLNSDDNPSFKVIATISTPLVKWIHFMADGHEQDINKLKNEIRRRSIKIPPKLKTTTLSRKIETAPEVSKDRDKLEKELKERIQKSMNDNPGFRKAELRTGPRFFAEAWLKARTVFGLLDNIRIDRFVQCLTNSRWRNAERLMEYYDNDGIDVYVAAMVDLDYWVEGKTSTQIEDQVRISSMISIVEDGRILPFVSYDPFRDVVEDGAALKIVKEAIENYGFVGVKLYPPMGFLPSGNNEAHYKKAIYAPWRSEPFNYTDKAFAKKIEARLQEFYSYCRKMDVSIMAHCNDSMYSEQAFKEAGLPKHWKTVLAPTTVLRNGQPTSVKLRVNLGHFGGRDGLLNPNKSPKWTKQIIELTKTTKVYGDTGNFHIRRGGAFKDYLKALKIQLDKPESKLANRFMYGSDWFMMISRSYGETYPKKAEKWFKEYLPEHSQKIMGENAIRFLGLDKSNSLTRKRLEAFYTKYKVKADWIKKLPK